VTTCAIHSGTRRRRPQQTGEDLPQLRYHHRRGFPTHPRPLRDQGPQRQQRLRHVVVPAHPTPYFVLPETGLTLARPERRFDGPAELHLPLAAPAGPPTRGTGAFPVADVGVAGYVEQVPRAVPPKPTTKPGRTAQLVVAADPGVGQIPATSLQQGDADPPRLLELDLLGDVAILPPRRVVRPILGQLEPPVQRRVPAGGGIDEEDAPPSWQLSCLPSRPQSSRAIPHDSVPDLGKALGSRIRIACGSARFSRTWPRSSARISSSSHPPAPTKFWIGLRWTPASTAIGSPVLRCKPRMTAWRGSVARRGRSGESRVAGVR